MRIRATRDAYPTPLFSITNVGQSLRAEAFTQLRQIKADGRDGRSMRFENSRRQFSAGFVAGFRAGFGLAGAANGPVQRAGRLLDDEGFGGAIPRDRPAGGPAVAGTHDAAIHQINPAFGHLAIVHEQPGGPAHVRLDMTVAVENAV